jgi:hypothetical protein
MVFRQRQLNLPLLTESGGAARHSVPVRGRPSIILIESPDFSINTLNSFGLSLRWMSLMERQLQCLRRDADRAPGNCVDY